MLARARVGEHSVHRGRWRGRTFFVAHQSRVEMMKMTEVIVIHHTPDTEVFEEFLPVPERAHWAPVTGKRCWVRFAVRSTHSNYQTLLNRISATLASQYDWWSALRALYIS